MAMAVDSALPSPLGTPACEKDAKALEFIEDMTKNVDSVQERVLAEILSQNSNTEYLQRFKLHGATDRDSFMSKVPVVTYEDIRPDITRVANGDKSSILSSHPISEFLNSSGTSAGTKKLIPTIHEEWGRRLKLYSLLMPVMNLYVPDLDKGKSLFFVFVKTATKTPGGIPAQPVLSGFYKSDQFQNRPYDPYMVYTSPNETMTCSDSFQKMYSQMLCGLLMRHEVLRMGAVFATGLLRAIRFLQLNWKLLAQDIKTGILNLKVADPSIRKCMYDILKPNPQLAESIVKECKGENWERIIPRIWPHTKYLDVIVTGTMAQYIPILDYYSGGLPLASTVYVSSECFFGLNLKPTCKPCDVSYTIMPFMGYFEFIPHDSSDSYPLSRESPVDLVQLANVELGKEYELVVTTYSGLYRYCIGDILQVTGFHNAAPQFKFMRRKNVILSIDMDKTDEAELQKGIETASALLQPYNTTIVDYTSSANTTTIPGHYVIYCELLMKDAAKMPSHEVLNECCLAIEESLSSPYRQGRVMDNSIGPLEIRVVKNGTFEELMDYAISRGASINQYKVPRCVSFTPIIELLDSRVVSVHFSPIAPQWAPDLRF